MLGKLCACQLWCFVSREIPFRDSEEEDTLLFSRDIRDFDLVQKKKGAKFVHVFVPPVIFIPQSQYFKQKTGSL